MSLFKKVSEELQHEAQQTLPKLPTIDWKIQEKSGKEIVLQKQFNGEDISILLSTDSLGEVDEEDSVEIPLSVLVTKNNKTMELQTTLKDAQFYIDQVTVMETALAKDETSEGDWKRRNVYSPVFDQLDEGLMEEFQIYLDSRGFNPELAEFIQEFLVFKEQKEYVKWLEGIKDFTQ
jgi:complement component 1 Q subcomponent-binding protein